MRRADPPHHRRLGRRLGAHRRLIVAYELGTIAAMAILVVTAHAGASVVRSHLLYHYGDAIAGGLIVTVGAAAAVAGDLMFALPR